MVEAMQAQDVLAAMQEAAGSDAPQVLLESLLGLEHAERGLAARAARYVLTGADPELPGHLATLPEPTAAHGMKIGRRLDAQAETALAGWTAQQSWDAQSEVLRRIQSVETAALIRYGQVFAALRELVGTREPRSVQLGLPAWAVALYCQITDREPSDGAIFDARQFAEALLADGVAEDDLPRLLVAMVLGTERAIPDRSVGLVELLLDHSSQVRALLPELSVWSVELLTHALAKGIAPLLEEFADILVDRMLNPPAKVPWGWQPLTAKEIRWHARTTLDGIAEPRRVQALARRLPDVPKAQLVEVAELLCTTEAGRAAVIDARERETRAIRVQALDEVLARTAPSQDGPDMPTPPPMPPIPDPRLDAVTLLDQLCAWVDQQAEKARREIERPRVRDELWADWMAEYHARDLRENTEMLRGFTALTRDSLASLLITAASQELAGMVDGLDSIAPPPGTLAPRALLTETEGLGKERRQYVLWQLRERVTEIVSDPLAQIRVMHNNAGGGVPGWSLHRHLRDIDLRVSFAVLLGAQAPDELHSATLWEYAGLEDWKGSLDTCLDKVSDEHTWPYFVEHADFLETAFGRGACPIKPGEAQALGLRVLSTFPELPPRYVPDVGRVAVEGNLANRARAQQLLTGHPQARALGESGLASGKAEVRAVAATWLGVAGDPAAVPALRGLLKKEKQGPVVAALLTALERLGDDISAELAPAKLTAAAVKGWAAKLPAGLDWFPFDALPELHWAVDGTVAAPEVARWWVVLGHKLKEPGGGGVLDRYLTAVAPADAAALGEFVLRAWVAEDTRTPTDEESRAYADEHAQSDYDLCRSMIATYGEQAQPYYHDLARLSLDELRERHRRAHARVLVTSAIGQKGVLALAVAAPAAVIATVGRAYLRAHDNRPAQMDALLRVAAGNGGDQAVQWLLSVAQRFRAAAVQESARQLAGELAERRGWSTDELADRTIPAAGFDDDGLLRLSYGEREFVGRITPDFGLELSIDGRVLKALPPAREGEDKTLASEARAQLKASREQLKQFVPEQTARLYEAMCAERTWSVPEWTEFLAEHPLMRRLIGQLVWRERGEGARLFRPEDGVLLGADDAELTLDPAARIEVAHGSLLAESDVAAWQAHLADYRVEPLFEQFHPAAPPTAPEQTSISDREGWASTVGALQSAADRRGYQRGEGDSVGYSEFVKRFVGLGIRAEIGFTGAEHHGTASTPAAVTSLFFVREQGRRIERLPVAEVPAVLRSEAYADYRAVAEVGAYHPDWGSMGW